MRAIVKFFLEKNLVVNLITVFVIIAGTLIASHTRRTAFPDVDMGMISIDTFYEGATATEIEQLVTEKIEDSLENVDGIKHYYSSSTQNLSNVFIEIEPDADSNKVVEDVKAEVNNVNDLPEECEDPIVKELDFSDRELLEIAIWGPDELRLRDYADRLEELLEEIPKISKVVKAGYREREIHVEVDPLKLEENRLTISDVVKAIETSSLNIPSGSVDGQAKEILIRTIGEAQTPEDIGNIFLRVNDAGNAVAVKDVASVFDTFEDSLSTYRADGHQAIDLKINMKKSGDAIDVTREAWEVLNEFKKRHPDINYIKGLDFSFFIKRRLNVLKWNGILGMTFVAVLLFLFLNWRIAVCTALGIPVAFLGTFFILDGLDMSINMLSMLGLILVLGMIVDDAIVVAENIYQKLEAGMEKKKAALEGTVEVIAPVSGTIITTMAAFLPLLLMEGIMGKFLRVVPIVIIASLFMSWLESMFILPTHIADLTTNKLISKELDWFNSVKTVYIRILRRCLKLRYAIFFGLIILLFLSFKLMRSQVDKFEMFPKQLIDTVFMRIEATEGTSRDQTEKIIQKIENEILEIMQEKTEISPEGDKVPLEVRSMIVHHGSSKESYLDPFGGQGDEFAFGRIELTPQKVREAKGLRMARELVELFHKRTKGISGLKDISFSSHKPGPPQGKAIDIQVKGKRFEDIALVTERIEDFLLSIPKVKIEGKAKSEDSEIAVVHDIKNELTSQKDEISVIIDKKRASEVGINTPGLASSIRLAFTGKTASTINRDGEEIEVKVRLNKLARSEEHNLEQLKIPNNNGMRIPLSAIAKLTNTESIAVIRHRDGKRVAYIEGEVDNDYIKPVALMRAINKVLKFKEDKEEGNQKGFFSFFKGKKKPLEKDEKTDFYVGKVKIPYIEPIQMPEGVSVSLGGEMDSSIEAMDSMRKATIIALLLIFFILAVTFNSLRLPLLVMAAIPFGAIGIIWAFYFHGEPYSFLGLIGAIGMTGVVVNDSIVLVDFIKRKREEGISPTDSIILSGKERLRPVILTSVTTLGGLAPTAYQLGVGDPFLVPIALSIGWGLAFATVLTLIALPCLYRIMDDIFGPFPKKIESDS